MSSISDNIQRVQEQINQACERAQRDPADITLVAVSKTHPVDLIMQAVEAGLQHFGESRVEESSVKIPEISQRTEKKLHWHMIGHIQSRKARHVVAGGFDLVHSVDSLKLARKLSGYALDHDEPLNVLIQINVSGEDTKSGLEAYGWQTDSTVRQQILAEMRELMALEGLSVQGLMTMAPFVDDEAIIRPVFSGLRELRDMLSEELSVSLPHLSMGMTDDFPIAIEEGATMIRVGRAIFGER